MPRYGEDLFSILSKRKFKLSKASVYDLGLKILDILEAIHESGLVYNDLKLDNILIDYGEEVSEFDPTATESCFKGISIRLVDFGFAT